MQLLTYRLSSYSVVLERSADIEKRGGKIIEVKVGERHFDDPLSVYKHNYERRPYSYKLVAILPMSAAIKFC